MSKRAKESSKKQTISPSKPIESLVRQWVWQDLVREIGKDNLQILDYYSQGNDAEWLGKQGYKAESFNRNNNKIKPNNQYDIVLCTYVLNKIEDEADTFEGATYLGSDGEVLRGGRYIQESYVIGNVSVGMTYESWKVEAFVDNVFDKSAILNIDTQQYTPKVVTNRPRTVGVRFSYDYY